MFTFSAFVKVNLLLIRHNTRGWDIPGGHIEPGESLDTALRRELFEEAAAIASSFCLLLFFIRLGGPKPPGYKYPYPESYISCFAGHLLELKAFHGEFETVERRLFTPTEVRGLEWYQSHTEMFELALEHISGVSDNNYIHTTSLDNRWCL